ncbi:hypothetical protein [Mesorhizobium sp.]|uniref:hypothetical protein n=1 Tax=Mesorhizobium sp. TaxID=1871066 RepID=UPI000FE59097|nr:hypothetical protein [Mesorhizobium sp.]RWP37068.1 MAG: hypothetical protein EOR03_06945 [Mesorhizobium sp.]
MNTETTTPQVEPKAKPASKAKVKKAAAPADVVQDGPFALARRSSGATRNRIVQRSSPPALRRG